MARICMVAFTHYSTDSRVRREAEALVDRGDEVDVLCLKEPGRENLRFLNGVRVYQLPVGRYRGSSTVRYLLKYMLFFLATTFWLDYLHLRKRYQVIQVHTMPDFMVFVTFIPRLLGAKVILDVHDLMPELYRSKFGLSESHWLIRFITWMERHSVGFAHRAIAVHKPHLDALVRHGDPAEKFIILLNLPDPKVFSERVKAESSKDGRFRLVYHGTVARRHGLHVALHALSKVKTEVKGLEFQIFGDGDDIPYLTSLAEELGLENQVRINRGMVPMDELVPFLLDADVGIVPILYDGFTRYMLPVKLLEYVALGIPVISSRTETIEAYFDDSMVQYCEPGDAESLAEGILAMYRNPGRRERIRMHADKFNRDYSWERQKQRYYRLIDNLISSMVKGIVA